MVTEDGLYCGEIWSDNFKVGQLVETSFHEIWRMKLIDHKTEKVIVEDP